MKFNFTKMQALGNDYIIINGFAYPDLINHGPDLAVPMSDRHFGIGGDGIIFVLPSEKADCMMRIFNADGSEAEMCGNGIRQVAKYVNDKKMIQKNPLKVETLAGIKTINIKTDEQGKMIEATVDMGAPLLEASQIPLVLPAASDSSRSFDLNVRGQLMKFCAVSMGNPHAITFVDDVKNTDVTGLGALIERNTDVFPNRTNVEFIEWISRKKIKMRVYERGSGETLACGTGACASAVASIIHDKCDSEIQVELLGGTLNISWKGEGHSVFMTGGAVIAFEGSTRTEDWIRP